MKAKKHSTNSSRWSDSLEYEYTSLYLPLEVDTALDLITGYVNTSNNVLLYANDESLLFKLLSRCYKETFVLTDKEKFFQNIKEVFHFPAVTWNRSSSIDVAVVALNEPDINSWEKLDILLSSSRTLIVLFPLFLRYRFAENQWGVSLSFFRDVAFPFFLARKMKNRGFEIEKIYGFRSIKSLLLNRLIWILNFMGKEALADRLYLRFTRSLCTASLPKYMSTLMLLVGRKNE